MNKYILVLYAVLGGALLLLWHELGDAKADVTRLTTERDGLSKALKRQLQQDRIELGISQTGLVSSQRGDVQQGKTKIEIREKIIHEPCASQFVPDGAADRVWKLTTFARASALPATAREPDGVAPATTTGSHAGQTQLR
jgi:hypothetical protein